MTAESISKIIPIEKLYKHPIVQELLNKIDKLENQDLEKIKVPYVIKNKTLMSPGVWNGFYYSADAIHDAFLKSEWDKKEIRSLFLDHEDSRSSEWIGEIKNPKMRGDDLIADLIIVDKPTAMKLAYGAKMGISPKVSGGEEDGKMVQFKYDNFSVVINPAVKTAYINNQEMEVKKMADVEEAKKQPKKELNENIKEKPKEEIKAPEIAVGNADELVDEILNAFTDIKELANVGAIAKKAKEIRKKYPDMKWTDAIKKAAKMISEEIAEKEKELAEDKILEQAIEIINARKKKYPYPEEKEKMAVKKKKYPDEEMAKKKYPYPDEEKKKMSVRTQKMNELIEKQSKTIQELSEKLDKVEAKLNEPDKTSIKSEELSQSIDPDEGFLNTLKNI